VSDIVVDKDMLKDAKTVQEKKKLPDGQIYSVVKGVKEFHPIERVYIKKIDMTIGDLVDKVLKQDERIEKLKLVNAEMLEKINELEGKVKLWIG
jgi:hypothetical protein